MKFSVVLLLDVDELENILPVDEGQHEQAIKEIVIDSLYDSDGVEVKAIKVMKK